MNYLIDVDTYLAPAGNMDRTFYEYFLEWSKRNRYYLYTSKTFDELYESVGKAIIYNAEASYTQEGRSVYIQSQLVEHDDVISKNLQQLSISLPKPIVYIGTSPELATITSLMEEVDAN